MVFYKYMFLQSAVKGILVKKCLQPHIKSGIWVKKCPRLHIEFAILVRKCPRLHIEFAILVRKCPLPSVRTSGVRGETFMLFQN